MDDRCREFVEQFRLWADGASATARRRKLGRTADAYGAQLADARAAVYTEAAELLTQHGVEEAVRAMVERAGRLRVSVPPLVRFDPAGLRYIRARAWQLCAQTLDPNVPVIQPPWE